jgi:Cft2 family RNA processing exonuclease
MKSIQLKPIAGASSTAENAYLLEIEDFRLLLDCGHKSQLSPEWVSKLPDIDLCWLSHAHRDHIGATPGLIQSQPRISLSATPLTKAYIEPLFGESDELSSARKRAIGRKIETLPVGDDREASRESLNIRLQPIRSGHIPGAASLLIEVEGERTRRILYSSDLCPHDQPNLEGFDIASLSGKSLDMVILEGTLSTAEHADKTNYSSELERFQSYLESTQTPIVMGIDSIGEVAQVASIAESTRLRFHSALNPFVEATARHGGGMTEIESAQSLQESEASSHLPESTVFVAPGNQFRPNSASGRIYRALRSGQSVAAVSLNAYRNSDIDAEVFTLPTHATRSELIDVATRLSPSRVGLVHGKRSGLYALKRAMESSDYNGDIEVLDNGEDYLI